MEQDYLTVGLPQIATVWLDLAATLAKVKDWIGRAATAGCGFVAFGEALVPGYPFWIEYTDGARFGSPLQKDIRYLDQAVQVEAGHLDGVRAAAARFRIAVMLGIIERLPTGADIASVATRDHRAVRRERQNFDQAGH